ncbi:hypothetical protein PC116_g15179 [Phytophthora cactorum]|uniref:Uncharacterized protein n=1 Tax=Phytophthora cactorum TaxID=29920 RepID=A0A8T1FXI5_9STRA|nr:hypothetical protein PC112_g12619 [Phytophthora cactorum]KAG2820601.1 hypothetical protein PC111_g11387 [Phytophthora cactorum]KAG2856024.1 hypothetical protein PC113_g11930 [Phytophthora cactorum]KAG2902869.1 hypothetical protein PC114_g12503 [Phytophthora cactorum]KAG2936779.1 hypothetical protein PC117_g11963 [Phytophthora cactorum]
MLPCITICRLGRVYGYFTLVKSKVTRLRLSLEPQLMDISTFSFGSMRITGVWGILSTKWLLPLGMDAYKGRGRWVDVQAVDTSLRLAIGIGQVEVVNLLGKRASVTQAVTQEDRMNGVNRKPCKRARLK